MKNKNANIQKREGQEVRLTYKHRQDIDIYNGKRRLFSVIRLKSILKLSFKVWYKLESITTLLSLPILSL